MNSWKLPWRRAKRKTRARRAGPPVASVKPPSPYTARQSKEVLERLRSLGYLG